MTDISDALTVTLTGDDSESVRAAASARGLDPHEWVRRQLRRQAGFDALAAATREHAGRTDPGASAWINSVKSGTQDLWRRTVERE